MPSRESMRKVDHWDDRDYWGDDDIPFDRIRRWIKSKVGGSFNNVFSQWSKLKWVPVRERNLRGFKRFVETDVVMINKIPFRKDCYRFQHTRITTVYVHPFTNNLTVPRRVAKTPGWYEREKEELSKRFIPITDYSHYCKIKGVWYEVALKDHFVRYTFDHVLKRAVPVRVSVKKNTPLDGLGLFLTRGIVLKKEQLSSKKLASLGLTNS